MEHVLVHTIADSWDSIDITSRDCHVGRAPSPPQELRRQMLVPGSKSMPANEAASSSGAFPVHSFICFALLVPALLLLSTNAEHEWPTKGRYQCENSATLQLPKQQQHTLMWPFLCMQSVVFKTAPCMCVCVVIYVLLYILEGVITRLPLCHSVKTETHFHRQENWGSGQLQDCWQSGFIWTQIWWPEVCNSSLPHLGRRVCFFASELLFPPYKRKYLTI